jgi:hypothetical protein
LLLTEKWIQEISLTLQDQPCPEAKDTGFP